MGIVTKTIALATVLAGAYMLGATGSCNYMMKKTDASQSVRADVNKANEHYRNLVDRVGEIMYSETHPKK